MSPTNKHLNWWQIGLGVAALVMSGIALWRSL